MSFKTELNLINQYRKRRYPKHKFRWDGNKLTMIGEDGTDGDQFSREDLIKKIPNFPKAVNEELDTQNLKEGYYWITTSDKRIPFIAELVQVGTSRNPRHQFCGTSGGASFVYLADNVISISEMIIHSRLTNV